MTANYSPTRTNWTRAKNRVSEILKILGMLNWQLTSVDQGIYTKYIKISPNILKACDMTPRYARSWDGIVIARNATWFRPGLARDLISPWVWWSHEQFRLHPMAPPCFQAPWGPWGHGSKNGDVKSWPWGSLQWLSWSVCRAVPWSPCPKQHRKNCLLDCLGTWREWIWVAGCAWRIGFIRATRGNMYRPLTKMVKVVVYLQLLHLCLGPLKAISLFISTRAKVFGIRWEFDSLLLPFLSVPNIYIYNSGWIPCGLKKWKNLLHYVTLFSIRNILMREVILVRVHFNRRRAKFCLLDLQICIGITEDRTYMNLLLNTVLYIQYSIYVNAAPLCLSVLFRLYLYFKEEVYIIYVVNTTLIMVIKFYQVVISC